MAPPDILESSEDNGEGRKVLRGSVYGGLGSDARNRLLPTIFNVVVDVVVDAVVCHWVSVMAEGVKAWGECGKEGRNFFYSSGTASVNLKHAHYWVVVFQPITAATRSLYYAPIVC